MILFLPINYKTHQLALLPLFYNNHLTLRTLRYKNLKTITHKISIKSIKNYKFTELKLKKNYLNEY